MMEQSSLSPSSRWLVINEFLSSLRTTDSTLVPRIRTFIESHSKSLITPGHKDDPMVDELSSFFESMTVGEVELEDVAMGDLDVEAVREHLARKSRSVPDKLPDNQQNNLSLKRKPAEHPMIDPPPAKKQASSTPGQRTWTSQGDVIDELWNEFIDNEVALTDLPEDMLVKPSGHGPILFALNYPPLTQRMDQSYGTTICKNEPCIQTMARKMRQSGKDEDQMAKSGVWFELFFRRTVVPKRGEAVGFPKGYPYACYGKDIVEFHSEFRSELWASLPQPFALLLGKPSTLWYDNNHSPSRYITFSDHEMFGKKPALRIEEENGEITRLIVPVLHPQNTWIPIKEELAELNDTIWNFILACAGIDFDPSYFSYWRAKMVKRQPVVPKDSWVQKKTVSNSEDLPIYTGPKPLPTDKIQDMKIRINCFVPGCKSAFFFPHRMKRHLFETHKIDMPVHEVRDKMIGKKPWQCSSCSKSYNHQSNVCNHEIKVHGRERKWIKSEIEKPWVCSEEGCDKAYAQQGNLSTHMRNDHGRAPHYTQDDRIHPCSLCDKKFSRTNRRDEHEQHAHGVVFAHQCDVDGCGKSFRLESSLNSHRPSHKKKSTK